MALLFAALLYLRFSDISLALRLNWGIELPGRAQCREVYAASTPSFHGDGPRFHAYTYEREQYIAEAFPWTSEQGKTFFYPSYSAAVTQWLNELSVPDAQRPDLESCKFWHMEKNECNEIILLWDSDMLYCAESFL